jgi:hypothetical protein
MPEQTPEGVAPPSEGHIAYSADSIGRRYRGISDLRNFSVEPGHTVLPTGVRFNVETVTPASAGDARLPAADVARNRAKQATAFYGVDAQVEVGSNADLVYAGGDGFLHACLTAFARHLPLSLSPDHVWCMIANGFAKHVDENAETLRDRFVQHKGKTELKVKVDHFVMGQMPPESWETDVFPEFARQIQEHVGDEVHGLVGATFSTSDAGARATHQIQLMASMKNYFSYTMRTMCGIPAVTLQGTRLDWAALRQRAEELGRYMTDDFAQHWLATLLPVLDEFVDAYDGNVRHGFWQSMVKMRHTGGGSGSHSFISGWIQAFYPYTCRGRPRAMLPWQESYFVGPEIGDLPTTVASAPVSWEYLGKTFPLHFHAGIAGCSQDATGALSPALGWYVTHAP